MRCGRKNACIGCEDCRPPEPARIKLKLFQIIESAVSTAASVGVRRAFKHDAGCTMDTIAEHVTREVMGELSDVIDFEASK